MCWRVFKHIVGEIIYSFFVVVVQLCLTLCNPTNCSMPGFPILHHLPEFAQTHVHCVSDTTQPSRPLSSPAPLNLSQHQGLFQWVTSSGGQSIGASASTSVSSKNIQDWRAVGGGRAINIMWLCFSIFQWEIYDPQEKTDKILFLPWELSLGSEAQGKRCWESTLIVISTALFQFYYFSTKQIAPES